MANPSEVIWKREVEMSKKNVDIYLIDCTAAGRGFTAYMTGQRGIPNYSSQIERVRKRLYTELKTKVFEWIFKC